MEVNYADGTLLWYWFEWWLVVPGFVATLLLAVLVTSRSGWGSGALLLKTLMIAGVSAALPLTLVRLGMNISVSDEDTIGYLSLAAVIGSVVVGIAYLTGTRRRGEGAVEAADEGLITPEAGVPLAPEVEGGTMTLETGGAVAQEAGTGDATLIGGIPGGQQAAQPTAAWVIFKSGPRAGQSIPLDPEMTSIGRGDESTVVIEDPSVSRRHATISFQEGTYVLEDEGSSGGTMVEGSTASRTELKSGSAIKIG